MLNAAIFFIETHKTNSFCSVSSQSPSPPDQIPFRILRRFTPYHRSKSRCGWTNIHSPFSSTNTSPLPTFPKSLRSSLQNESPAFPPLHSLHSTQLFILHNLYSYSTIIHILSGPVSRMSAYSAQMFGVFSPVD
ncbi:hypothetical protein MANES_17G097850v8 [Manihot esculenta]|uniref:Uncharacterized protein n=1 Tax=Manihot esculenta TaxID=3983 RepID=A0ACB7G3S4_MANES|nr:hypothetical protein MANES_17G097850v8 [Manihot esculenta]